MKKILYLFLVIPLIFASCTKEEENTPTAVQGCTDVDATNYNASATSDNGSCLYDISGVWETTSAILNGSDALLGQSELTYIWENGDIGSETYDANGNIINSALGSSVSSGINVIDWTGTVYDQLAGTSFAAYLTINIDIMTNNNNMTWHYVDYPTANDNYIKTLVRSDTYSLSDWK